MAVVHPDPITLPTDSDMPFYFGNFEKRIASRNASCGTIRMKIHQVFLVLIGFWMVYAWLRGQLFANPPAEEVAKQTEFEKSLSFHPDNILPRLCKYALIYLVQFWSDPFNLTLIILASLSRIVLNFVTIVVRFTMKKVWYEYEVDLSYFNPVDHKYELDSDDFV